MTRLDKVQSWSVPRVSSLPGNGASSGQPLEILVHDSGSGTVIPVGSTSAFTMYVCGITPYDATHMGHAATYVAFDVLNRVNRDAGRRVTYVQNVTDIDDPLLERATATSVDWEDLATSQIELFRQDMTALRVIPPEHYVSAIAEIPAVVQRVEQLRSTGAAYQLDGDWYFSRTEHLGDVSHLPSESMRIIFGERGGDPDRPGKQDPLDCLIWLRARPGEPSWPSSLGEGRPGWHIECTTIAMDRLPLPIDVQGGGNDLSFPHHDMCNMQAHMLQGAPLASAFVHTGMIGLDGEKMSKSRGNLVLVSQLRATGVDPMAIRLALLAGHYRANRDWTPQLLATAQHRLALWRSASSVDAGALLVDVRSALRDDLDTPRALLAIDSTAKDGISSEGGAVTLAEVVDTLLGITLD